MSDLERPAAVPLRSYTGPACPRCGAALAPAQMAAGPQACPGCGRPFEATPFVPPPAPAPPPVRSVAEAGPEGAAPCALHAGNAAESSCTRCGVLMCALCRIDADGQALCPGCFDRLRAAAALPAFANRFPNYGGRAILAGILGCCPFYFLGIFIGPVAIYFAAKAVAQRRRTGEGERRTTIALAFVLGIAQIAFFVVLAIAIGAAFFEGVKSP